MRVRPNNQNIVRCLVVSALAFSLALPSLLRAQDSSPSRVYTLGWAGYVLYSPGEVNLEIPHHRFQTIEGEWIIPSALPTINCSLRNKKGQVLEPTDGSSIWVGLDGWGETYREPDGTPSTDILQAGSETDVPCWNGHPQPASTYFWIEWDGTRNIPINWPVDIGDQIHVRISVDTDGPDAWQSATVYLDDETTKKSYSKSFHSGCLYKYCGKDKVDATLFGNTAEWVVETTFYSSPLPLTLDNFGITKVTNISVTDNEGNVYTPATPRGGKQQIDWMTWNGTPLDDDGTLLACAAITGSQSLTLSRAPYKIVKPGDQGNLEPKPQTCAGIN
jgi:hypothetical protein